jgi:SAM-dependent methyltransferase
VGTGSSRRGAVRRLKELVPRQARPALRRQVAAAAGRAGRPLIATGALTGHLLDTYASGRGVEIGPGASPYGRRPGTVLLDRFAERHLRRSTVDVFGDGRHLPFADQALDHVIAAHVLEHQPDVLGALDEWRRVLRPSGHLVLILPHLERTFDRRREASDAAHHRAEHGTAVDLHLDEAHWRSVETGLDVPHYWMDDPQARRADGSWNREWMAANQLVHWHAWTQHEMTAILADAGFEVVAALEQLPERPDSFLAIGRRPAPAG